jgi:hypothetical protein
MIKILIRNRHGRDHMVVEVVSSNPAHGEMYLSYLMGVQAIDQNIFPEVLQRPICSIARGQ